MRLKAVLFEFLYDIIGIFMIAGGIFGIRFLASKTSVFIIYVTAIFIGAGIIIYKDIKRRK